MDFSTVQGAFGLLGSGIAWLTAELLRREKAHTKDRTERKSLYEAHLGDIKAVNATLVAENKAYRESADQTVREQRQQDSKSLEIIQAMGDKYAGLTQEIRQVTNMVFSASRHS